MQFGAKPLFENVSVKFGDGNRYGLIGANGFGSSRYIDYGCEKVYENVDIQNLSTAKQVIK